MGFTLCGRIAFFGALGPVGIGGSCDAGGLGAGGVVGGLLGVCCEEENLEEMLDSHEFRLELGDGDPDLGMLPFKVAIFSVDVLLENPGLCAAIGLGGVDAAIGDGSGGN